MGMVIANPLSWELEMRGWSFPIHFVGNKKLGLSERSSDVAGTFTQGQLPHFFPLVSDECGCPLICLIRTACLARALHCASLFARSLTPELMGQSDIFFSFSNDDDVMGPDVTRRIWQKKSWTSACTTRAVMMMTKFHSMFSIKKSISPNL